MRERWINVAGLLMLLATAGCRSAKDDPTGIILVGSPEVSTRERLVNDRLTQDGWLRKQLEASDGVSFDDFQGLLDERMLTALSVNASINANPNDLAIHNAESASRLQSVEQSSELSSLDHEIAVLQKQKQIAQLRQATPSTGDTTQDTAEDAGTGSGTGSGSGTGTNQAATNVSRPSSPATDLAGNLLTRLASSQRAALPDPSTIATTKAKSSPIEALRDRLAYREEIRNEILENQLDDRHDLSGNTLYRFNVDATMVPSAGNSAWGIVDVKVENEDKRKPSEIYAEWVPSFQRQFEREINAHLLRILYCLGDLAATAPSSRKCGVSVADMEELIALGSTRLGSYPAGQGDRSATGLTYEQQVQMDLRAILRSLAGENVARQRVELELLIAEKLRADYFYRGNFGHYIPVPAIGEQRCAVAPTRVTRVMKWCGAAAELCAPLPSSPHYECVSAIRAVEAPRQRDLRELRFQCAIGAAWHVYAYSATPKDSVQRISRVAAARNTLELAAAVSALTGAASLDAATAFIRDNQRLMQTILREPLVVGYTEAGKAPGPQAGSGTAHFGWLIGPRFGLEQKPFRRERVSMDHRPIQNSLAAAISLPAWSKLAKVTIRTCWKSKTSIQGTSNEPCKDDDEREHLAELPGRIEAINDMLLHRPEPRPHGWDIYEVVTGSPAALLIKGSNLWRSTEVTLGAQTADEIRVLSDMTGIIARFREVKEPASLDGTGARTVDVNIWTSGGNQAVGEARIYPRKKGDTAWKIAWRQPPRIIKDEEIAIDLLEGSLPASYAKLELLVDGLDSSKGDWTAPIRLTGMTRDKTVVAKLSNVAGLSSGMEVRGSVWMLLRPDSAAVEIKATDGTAIYYATASEAKIQTPENLKSGGKLTLTFPKRVAHAYPGYQRPTVTATAMPAALTASLSAANWKTTADGQEVLEHTVTITGTIDPAVKPKLVLTVKPLAEGLVMDKTEIPLIQ